MTDERPQVKAFILINLDRSHQSVSSIEAILEPLGIPVSMVESGRRLHWTTAVVIGVPEQRLADAMLALELKGFPDVMAFHSEPDGEARQHGVEEQ
jgi:hypothetical protein